MFHTELRTADAFVWYSLWLPLVSHVDSIPEDSLIQIEPVFFDWQSYWPAGRTFLRSKLNHPQISRHFLKHPLLLPQLCAVTSVDWWWCWLVLLGIAVGSYISFPLQDQVYQCMILSGGTRRRTHKCPLAEDWPSQVLHTGLALLVSSSYCHWCPICPRWMEGGDCELLLLEVWTLPHQ